MTERYPMLPPAADSVHAFSPQPAIRQPESQTLTGASRKPAGGLSRRLMPAWLAVLPAAVPAAAEKLADPIFGAIAACRAAKAASDAAYARVRNLYQEAAEAGLGGDSPLAGRYAFVEARLGRHPDEYTDGPAFALWDCYEEFAEIEPTTLPGLFAMLIYAGEVAECDRDAFNDVDIFSTFAAAANALLGRQA